MEIFEFSWRIERQAEFAYRSLEKNASSTLMKHLFSSLANVEMHHYEMIQRLAKGEIVKNQENSIFPSAREALSDLTLSRRALRSAVSQIEVYRAVRDSEEASERFYRQKAIETSVMEHRQFFLALAEEEREHAVLLSLMIDLIESARVSERRPGLTKAPVELESHPA